MHVSAILRLLPLGLLVAACDTFPPDTTAPPVALASAKAPPPSDVEARTLARAAMTALLAKVKTCTLDGCFGWTLWSAEGDMCEWDRAPRVDAKTPAQPFLAYVKAHPELDGKVKTFATHLQLFVDWLDADPYRGVLARFQATAIAYNAFMTDEPVEVDPVDVMRCSRSRGWEYRLSKVHPQMRRPIPWIRCNGVACFRTDEPR